MQKLAIPTLTIALGIAWLLNVQGYFPRIDWLWTIGLAAAGLLTFISMRFDRFSFVLGSFLLICSVFSVLRQTEAITVNQELPLLVVAFGALMLFSQMVAPP